MPKPKVSLVQKSAAKKPKAAHAAGPVVNFVFQDNQDASFTVFGQDAAGNMVDITDVANLSVSSDDTSKVTVDAPVGMTSAIHAVGPLTAGVPVNLNVSVSWKDGSIGPFSLVQPIDVVGGPTTGLALVFGTPTSR